MTLRSSLPIIGGLLLALATLAPAAADAQVPVTKERPGQGRPGMRMVDTVEVVRVRVDTLYRDQLVVRTDTIVVTDTIYRYRYGGILGGGPLVTEEEEREALRDRWFFSLGGGASFPMNDFGDAYDTGWHAMAATGFRTRNPLALRLIGTYNNFAGGTIEDIDTIELDDAFIWSVGGDVLFDLFGARNPGGGLYLLAGGGYYGLDEDAFGSSGEFGVNAGAGLRFGLAGMSLFLEGKWTRVFVEDQDIDFIPVTLGISF